jgi:DNA-binding protein HU-beta
LKGASQITSNSFKEEFTMNKSELVDAIAAKTELSKKDSEKALKAFTEVVTDQLKKGDKIQLVGFGTFEVISRKARDGRNPSTGKPMKIKASKAPKFKPGKGLKDAVNAGKKKK